MHQCHLQHQALSFEESNYLQRDQSHKGLPLEEQGRGDPVRIGSASFTSQFLNMNLPNVRLVFEPLHGRLSYTALLFHLWTAHLSGSRDHSCEILDPEEQGHLSVGLHLL